MSLITINDENISNNFEAGTTIKVLKDHISNEIKKHDNIIKNIVLNGDIIDESSFEEIEMKELNEFESINFNIISRIELAFEALESSPLYLTTLREKIIELSQNYKKNEIELGNNLFIEVTSLLDLFIQLMGQIQNVFKTHPKINLEKSQKAQELELGLLKILKDIVPARQNNDFIMLCDLLEYELIDNLDQWKNQILPLLESKRKLVSSNKLTSQANPID